MKTVSDKLLPPRLSTCVCIGLMSMSLGGCKPACECDQATTLNDLEEQLTRQVREQWAGEQFETVEILEFGSITPGLGYVPVLVEVYWTPHRSTRTGMKLYRAADNYCVGTLTLSDKQKPVNVILKFG